MGAAANSHSPPNWLSTTIAGMSSAGCTSRMPRDTRVSTTSLPIWLADDVDRRPGRRRRDRAADGEHQQDREEAEEVPELRDQLQDAEERRPRHGYRNSRCPSPGRSSRPSQIRKPTTIASTTWTRRNVPNTRSTIRHRPTTSGRIAGGEHVGDVALELPLVGDERQDPDRDHQQAEDEAEGPGEAQDLVRDERPGALDETLHGGLEVGRRLGRDREDDAAERAPGAGRAGASRSDQAAPGSAPGSAAARATVTMPAEQRRHDERRRRRTMTASATISAITAARNRGMYRSSRLAIGRTA